MEAATLQKKKNKLSKGKLKKTIKNILCRSDPMFWPEIANDKAIIIKEELSKHKVDVPTYVKPHWSEIKDVPKSERRKAPKLQKVNGLLFGINKCAESISNKSCSGVILEADINPRIMVQHVVELCTTTKVPIICLKGLKNFCKQNFGIPSSCIAVNSKVNSVSSIADAIGKVAPAHVTTSEVSLKIENEEMNTEEISELVKTENTKIFPYLYRTTKQNRVFIPPVENYIPEMKKSFSGQDFIEFPSNKSLDQNLYKKMIVKRVSNNQNRKIKKKQE